MKFHPVKNSDIGLDPIFTFFNSTYCRSQIKKMSETNKEAVKKLADEDATRRIKQLEDQVEFRV